MNDYPRKAYQYDEAVERITMYFSRDCVDSTIKAMKNDAEFKEHVVREIEALIEKG